VSAADREEDLEVAVTGQAGDRRAIGRPLIDQHPPDDWKRPDDVAHLYLNRTGTRAAVISDLGTGTGYRAVGTKGLLERVLEALGAVERRQFHREMDEEEMLQRGLG